MEIYQIRTSDRVSFLRCRRKWSFSSGLRGNLTTKNAVSHFWFGTGFHYAMEDFWGFNRFKHPWIAFQAYDKARGEDQRPAEYDQLMELAEALFDYLPGWLANREEYKTVWAFGQPMVELNMRYLIPELSNADRQVYYNYTIDRIVEDVYGNYWLMDYKTYKSFDTAKLATDTQISAYLAMTERQLGIPIEGLIYWQFVKKVPEEPTMLKKGFSKAKSQPTTYKMYKKALLREFGKVPGEYREILEHFQELDTPDGDAIIRWDQVVRNQPQKENQYRNMLFQARDMINPKLPLYPNHTRDCSWDCTFKEACLMIDDGLNGDAQDYLNLEFVQYFQDERWRQRLVYPD